MKILSFLLACLVSSSLWAETEPTFHKVKPLEGDGVLALMRRYKLDGHSANLEKFYSLNQLKRGASLIQGRSYFLPIIVYAYNGRSIRSTIGIDDWDRATRIANFNRALQDQGVRESSYEESRILWVPLHELQGNTSPSPSAKHVSSTTMTVPMFGPEYETLNVTSQALRGKIFYIVSGHGGPDPGAMSSVRGTNICEDEYAYDVSLRLARRLMENGATVHMIIQDPNDGIRDESILLCDRDEVSVNQDDLPLKQLARLNQRTNAINRLHQDYLDRGEKDHIVVCIHVDSRSPHQRQDVFFYYYEGSRSSKRLADNLQKTFRSKYRKNRPGRGYHGTVSARNLWMLKRTNPTAVYVELANIRNVADRQRILPESNRQALANWLYEGLMR